MTIRMRSPRPSGSQAKPEVLDRRAFLRRLSLWLSGLGALMVGMPVIGFLLGPLLRRPQPMWQVVGQVEQFEIGTTVQVTFPQTSPLKWSATPLPMGAWLRREGEQSFVAFSVSCSHLGCPVSWLPDATLFMCPCHGGVYYRDGAVAAGPPPHPLSRYPVRLRDGNVEILAEPMPVTASAPARSA